MDGDYITVNTTNGPVKAELVSKFGIKGFGEYILYKIDDIIYGAKYEKDGTLKTDLSEAEKNAINETYLKLGEKI